METFQNVACTICGCVCDDLQFTVDRGRVIRMEGTCPLSETWFREQGTISPPAATIAGRSVEMDAAVERAAELLNGADSPLVYGLSRSSTSGQRAAVALAERIGATIDSTASNCHATSMVALQEFGECTCTLGEIRNRADLVVFWGADPVRTHPRHLERYSLYPQGKLTRGGRADRTMVVVGSDRTATSELADVYIPIEPERDFEALKALRDLVQGRSVSAEDAVGAPLEALRDLAERMKRCRYGIVFFGLGLSLTGAAQHNVEALLMLVRDLNAYTRFFARRLRIQGDVSGADNVLSWQTGFPFSVNLSRGYPRYNPGEFSAEQMLERGDVDACLLIGSEGVSQMSASAQARLRSIPTIALEYPGLATLPSPDVQFTTAVYGIHRPGTVYRMDNVPIPLRPFLHSDYPSDSEVLEAVTAKLPNE